MAAADQEPHTSAVRPRSYQDESYLHGFLATVADLQKAGVLQDVVLEVEDRRFPCHRLVLSAASPYFRAMFTNDMAESRQKTVVLQGLDAGMFCEILSYIYSGTLHVSLDKVQPLYQAADLLQLDYVRDTCSSYMAMNVERSTCVDILHHLPSILPHIRFNLLTSDDTSAILEHPLVRENPGSSEVIKNMVQEGNPDLMPRVGRTTEMVLLSRAASSDVLFMNPPEGKYISYSYDRKDLPDTANVTVTSDNNIYVLTCEEERSVQLSLFKYNHAGNLWEDAGMSSVSKWLRRGKDLEYYYKHLVEVDHILYYLAVDEDEGVLLMIKYNQPTDHWEECSQLQLDNTLSAVYNVLALSCGPHLYFLTSDELHRYDPSQDRWCKRTSPGYFPEVCTAVAMGTEIFCTDMDLTQTMVYDTESDQWQTLQSWPNPGDFDIHDVPSLFVLGSQLHVLFSCTSDPEERCRNLLYVYDRSADAWRDLKATLPNNDYDARGPHFPVAHREAHVSTVRPRSYQDESYLHGFLGTVGDLQKAGVLQDVVLEVEGQRFPCHRLVLSAASPYFRAMFTSDMAESRQKTVALQSHVIIINMAAADQEPYVSAVRPRSYQDESYLHGFLGTVDDLQKAGVLQDVVLEVEGRRFPCHRLVLSAASPYFRAMFTSDMAESRQKTVVLQVGFT
uniref:BTB domain-containing protein n=1 Tax=Branchiostoma floridae TaxID=7739 RepID=C3YNB4_BRAFL|eukprot:XP_002602208.1 hypothetical protein BRAFLDRAFT_76897 [Branchiostoma floridae]